LEQNLAGHVPAGQRLESGDPFRFGCRIYVKELLRKLSFLSSVTEVTDFPAWFDPSKDRMLTPSTVKGLLHPIRLRVFDLLQVDGPATATTLGRRIGQSTALASYHLRVLAEHGFVVEDAERGDRRERWWRAAHRSALFTFRAAEDPGTPETVEDAAAFIHLVAEESHRKVLAFISSLAGQPGVDLAELPWPRNRGFLSLSPGSNLARSGSLPTLNAWQQRPGGRWTMTR